MALPLRQIHPVTRNPNHSKGLSVVPMLPAGHVAEHMSFAASTPPMHHTSFPYVFLDAAYLHVRRGSAGGQ
jgi:hypothetical protein